MAAGKRKRGGSTAKKREAMSKFGARVEPNDEKPGFDHGVGMLGAAKFPIEGKHDLKMVKGSKAHAKVTKRKKKVA
jgi:hypothetical protein